MSDEISSSISVNHYKCVNCGADLTYAPGTTKLACEYCGTEMVIADAERAATVEETDFSKFLSENDISEDQKCVVHTINCGSCGAVTTLAENVTSGECSFCGTPLVVSNAQTKTIIKPRYLLPFKIVQKDALSAYKQWIQKLWFAPNKLKLYGSTADKLSGIYIPYWTYDAQTETDYRGERGTDHTETYTVTNNGKSETRTRTVTRWRPVSGHISEFFDDVMILASTSLPRKYTEKLEPWDLENLVEFNEQYLSGFRSESYQVSLTDGFTDAKSVMDTRIRGSIRIDIGGDHQRINWLSTDHSGITFKHILLPIWISAYRFNNKVYRFMINGRTGEVQGERPWSWVKITLATLGASSAAALIYYIWQMYN
jgi:DNA-directed RNA polymerase subunit RPC12/RpoP